MDSFTKKRSYTKDSASIDDKFSGSGSVGRMGGATEKSEKKHSSRFRTYLFIGLSALIGGYSFGRFQESRDHLVYEYLMRAQVIEAVSKGYSFAPDADPEFFKYHAALYKDDATKTIAGVMVQDDSLVIGPVRSGGRVGMKWYETIGEDARRLYDNWSDKASHIWEDLSRKIKGGYDREIDHDKKVGPDSTRLYQENSAMNK